MTLTIATRRALERAQQQQEAQRLAAQRRETLALIAALEPHIHTQPPTKPAHIHYVAISDTHGDPIREWGIPRPRKFAPFWRRRARAQAERTNQMFRAACNSPQAERVSRNRFFRAIFSACRAFQREWCRDYL